MDTSYARVGNVGACASSSRLHPAAYERQQVVQGAAALPGVAGGGGGGCERRGRPSGAGPRSWTLLEGSRRHALDAILDVADVVLMTQVRHPGRRSSSTALLHECDDGSCAALARSRRPGCTAHAAHTSAVSSSSRDLPDFLIRYDSAAASNHHSRTCFQAVHTCRRTGLCGRGCAVRGCAPAAAGSGAEGAVGRAGGGGGGHGVRGPRGGGRLGAGPPRHRHLVGRHQAGRRWCCAVRPGRRRAHPH